MNDLQQDGGRQSVFDWQKVYRENLPRVYNYLRFRVGDDLVAEDLTSSTFEKAWKSRYRYKREIGAFSNWLFSIASNLAIDYFRKKRAEVSLEQLDAHGSAQSAEEISERNAQYARLLLLLEELPMRERELFSLKYGTDLTNREIATVTGLSESNVGTILHRVAGQLRAKLNGYKGTPAVVVHGQCRFVGNPQSVQAYESLEMEWEGSITRLYWEQEGVYYELFASDVDSEALIMMAESAR